MDNLFIGLGFMKCATTFLSVRLPRHPDIFMPPVRELRFWNSHFQGQPLPRQKRYARSSLERIREQLRRDQPLDTPLALLAYWNRYSQTATGGLDDYLTLFAEGAGKAAMGEISPVYATLGAAELAEMARLMPGVRILITLRAPLPRLVSHLAHDARLRPGTLDTDEAVLDWLASPRVAAQTDYPVLLSRAFAAFGRDRVKPVFIEDLIADEEAYFRDLLGFLGVGWDPAVLPPDRPRNAAPKPELSPALQAAFAARVAGVAEAVEALLGRVPAAWKAA